MNQRLISKRTAWSRTYFLATLMMALYLAACATDLPQLTASEPKMVSVTVDGEVLEFETTAGNVREILEEARITLNEADVVDPPGYTPLTEGLAVRVTRVTESIEYIEQGIPFKRKVVRNEAMTAEDEPIILQAGKPGLQEITIRIVYHDGLEFSRQQVSVNVAEPAQDEIVMIGIGAAPGNVAIAGQLAYISGGSSLIMRGSSTFPEQINTGGELDHRVYRLSPTGSHLLYTRVTTDTDRFNTLWVVGTERGAEPRSLEVDNVLWADWNPGQADSLQLAYSTGLATELLPGWEANNDLWLGELPASESSPFRPQRIVEAYPATYGWWGGNYAWSPDGRYIAYAYADEVGVIDTEAEDDEDRRIQLQAFTEYNTRADWVWVPSLSWSPDGLYLAYTRHAGSDPDTADFDTWVVDVVNAIASPFVEQSGMWSHPHWSPTLVETEDGDSRISQIAFLRATNPLDSMRSSYTLWLMDRDGSNTVQVYPPAGENSRFPRDQAFMAWSPSGRQIAFIFNNDLYLTDLESDSTYPLTQDDNPVSSPTWAPYGIAVTEAYGWEWASPTDIPPPRSGLVPAE
jgi:hypothetical protein